MVTIYFFLLELQNIFVNLSNFAKHRKDLSSLKWKFLKIKHEIQKDSVNCGPYVCYFLKYLFENWTEKNLQNIPACEISEFRDLFSKLLKLNQVYTSLKIRNFFLIFY